jgi:hypothetical protein
VLRSLPGILAVLLLLLPGLAGAQPRLTSERLDALIEAELAREGIAPAPLAGDAEFLRRASLDIRGVIPSVEEASAFLSDSGPDRRARWIDIFLADARRGERWANYWDRLLVGTLDASSASPTREARMKAPWRDWVAKQFNGNVPLDRFATAIIAAEGPTDLAPWTLPVARWEGSAPDVAGTMSRVFLGRQIQCAQCHNHPYDQTLTQHKFWEAAAFFTRHQTRDMQSIAGRQIGRQVVERISGETEIPDTTPPVRVQPAWMDGTPGPRGDSTRRRSSFALLMMERDGDQFARNFVNRVWAAYFGRGFLNPVDDWQDPSVKPSHPAALDALAAEFRASGHDVRALERLIANTRTYQRALAAPGTPQAERPELFAAAQLRPLPPEKLFASLTEALGAGSKFRDRQGRRSEALIARYRADFVHLFGNDEMEEAMPFEASLPQALFLSNDSGLNGLLRGKGSLVSRVRSATRDPREAIDYLFLATLSRPATDGELDRLAEEFARLDPREQTEFLEDVVWALVNSTEFRTSH